jgi:hypothetical protein
MSTLLHWLPCVCILSAFATVLFVAFELNVVAERIWKGLRRRGQPKVPHFMFTNTERF